MRAFTKFTRNKGTSNTLGTDADPNSTAPVPNADNVVRVQSASSWSSGLKRLGLGLSASTGSSDLSVELWVKDDLTGKWYLAQPSMTLTHEAITYSTLIPAPTNCALRNPTTGDITRDDFVEVYVRLIDPGAAANADYTCTVIGDYVN